MWWRCMECTLLLEAVVIPERKSGGLRYGVLGCVSASLGE